MSTTSNIIEAGYKRITAFLSEDDRAIVTAYIELREGAAREAGRTVGAREDGGCIALIVGAFLAVVVGFLTICYVASAETGDRCTGWCAHENRVGAYNIVGGCTCEDPVEQAVWKPAAEPSSAPVEPLSSGAPL